ncbi:hypothetical protein [Desulfovibrio sp. ZJ200]|uniref:hypothetical protein n=1 Tax=Desulfovibrio sp. ZJ200 TaxID=2709792 RepID=UPI0013EE2F79|nr:hypothetical protein [Desulfovibrio sp. ZJ200]
MLGSKQELRQFQRYAIAVNADRFRVTCIKMEQDGEKKTFILDKKDGASKNFLPTSWRQECLRCFGFRNAEKTSITRPFPKGNIISSSTI